jgi:hypothetical protein
MNHTFWEYSDVPAAELVIGYRLENGNRVKQPMLHKGAFGAMGGILTSIEDFAKYMALHIAALPAGKEEIGIIKKSTLREMHLSGPVVSVNVQTRDVTGNSCPSVESYNNGLQFSKDCNDREMIEHSGGLPGFGSHWIFLPQYGIGVVAFCNRTYVAPVYLNHAIVDSIVTMLGLKPNPVAGSAILEQRKSELIALLPDWKNAETAGIFAENFFLDNNIESLKKQSQALFLKAGKIKSVGKMIPENALRGSCIIEGEHINIRLNFTLSPEHIPLIQEYYIGEIRKAAGTIKIDSATLRQYVGEYEREEGGVVTKVYLTAGNTLMLSLPNQPAYELAATGKDEFGIKGLPEYGVKFDVSENKATSITFIQPNGVFEIPRKKE